LAWSPDGTKIVFASDRSGFFRLYVMDADGHNVREMTHSDNPGGNAYPAWSPDGKRIAFTNSTPDGSRQIFMIDADGKNTKQLTKDGIFNCYVAWSPEGKKLAACLFLAKSQSEDGSWAVRGTKQNAKDRVEATSTFWGTCWAVIGLCASLDN
jgi:Tol biopolymer transport system component